MRILVADPLSEAGLQLLKQRGLQADVKTGLPEADLIQAVPPYEGLIVRSQANVTRRVLEAGKNLRVVGRAGVGVDNIDEEAATERGILVMNTPTGNTLAVAEHTMALLLSLARHVPQAAASLRAGHWDRKSFGGIELSGKTLGIIGLGRIGREVAARCRAFQMRVLAHDPFISKDLAREVGVELMPMDQLLSESDFITVHTPLTQDTEGLLGAAEIRRMKRGVRLLNVARGGIIEEEALLEGLRGGHVAAAAVDVWKEEPPKNRALVEHPNLVGTPHLGASTHEAQEKVAYQIAEQVADYLLDGKISNAVNMPHPVVPALQPFVDLAQGMGAFAVQLNHANPEQVQVTCRGDLAKLDTHPVAVAALAGILARASEGKVNLVNAERRAKEHGIPFVQTKTESIQDYASSVELVLQTSAGSVTMLGTALARLGPRIVTLNGYEVEFKPWGRFLVVPHRDQPGTVAKISSVLGRENINIAQMVVGRLEARGPAISILRVDDPVPVQVVEEIRRILEAPGVQYVTVPRPGAAGRD